MRRKTLAFGGPSLVILFLLSRLTLSSYIPRHTLSYNPPQGGDAAFPGATGSLDVSAIHTVVLALSVRGVQGGSASTSTAKPTPQSSSAQGSKASSSVDPPAPTVSVLTVSELKAQSSSAPESIPPISTAPESKPPTPTTPESTPPSSNTPLPKLTTSNAPEPKPASSNAPEPKPTTAPLPEGTTILKSIITISNSPVATVWRTSTRSRSDTPDPTSVDPTSDPTSVPSASETATTPPPNSSTSSSGGLSKSDKIALGVGIPSAVGAVAAVWGCIHQMRRRL
ncbi:hypothetical protein BCR34DRAFT_602035 [Clohesyomyces aquaticus]|uniref:Uncharacterized protein n=1 Tax=Clohesyomyces aquaticus TaxID=1231657 RepID=A0A1Y1ZK62_9PLEO|nr:hypothetical protein BCR34DRAFT_602035 [Clohesyomyces aquaticus]